MFKNKGFTLIEILVVVLIIGILAGIALPQYNLAVMKSKYSTLKNITRSLADAEERYFLTNHSYTSDVTALDVQFPETPTSISGNELQKYYYFNWGLCILTVSEGNDRSPRIACNNNSINLRFTIHLRRPPSNAGISSQRCAGRRRCNIVNSTSPKINLNRKLCAQETRDPSPSYNELEYWYQ